jgi:diguanylate cyclase (GGDEF)-like protein/PAS domain S-box-containing protein
MRRHSLILLIEDNPGDARLLHEMLSEQSSQHAFDVVRVTCMREAEEQLAGGSFEIILLDLGLPDAQGLDAVRRARAAGPRIALVVLTGLDDEALAMQTLQQGAQDYLIKGQIEALGLLRALRYAVERKLLEDALFVEKERAQVTLSSIGDGVICTDVAGDITFINLVAENMTGWSAHEARGRPNGDVFRVLDAGTRAPISNPLATVDGKGPALPQPSNYLLVRRDGVEIPIDDAVAPIHGRQGELTGAVIVFRDVSAARRMALQMAHAAQHDHLTGLPNRMLLHDRIGQAIALVPRHDKQVAVLFIDVDGFKHINDSLGHSIGDKLLQSIAKCLVTCVRTSDTVSRQGGDEFVLLLSEVVEWENATTVAQRVLRAVADAHSIDLLDLHVTASIGISIYPDDGRDAETLIKNADTAMYQAKENGRNSYQFFKPVMNVRAVERQSLEEGLRGALSRGELVLHYQPKIDIATGAINGAEALVRWAHPTRGLVPPMVFIPIAESSGLIVPIGNWVLREACRQARVWRDQGLFTGTIAVNVSALELRSEDFLTGLWESLQDVGLDPQALELELTESVLMKHAELTAKILQTVRGKGVQVAIDDFGTGYSSLSYLRKFPIDALKIDRSFVAQVGASDADAAIVVAVMSMAHGLGLRVVAEGVETRAQLDFLRARGCEEAQGYYFSRPLPPLQFAQLLTAGIPQPPSGVLEASSIAS